VRVQRRDRVRLHGRLRCRTRLAKDPVDDAAVLHVLGQERQRHRCRLRPGHRRTVAERAVGARQQHVALPVEPQRAHAREWLGVEVGEADVEIECLQAALDLHRVERMHGHGHAGMPLGERRRQQRHRRQRRRDRTDAKPPRQAVPHRAHLAAEPVDVREDALRPLEHALALGGEALVPLRASHDGQPELLLQPADPGRQRRLRDVARGRGAAEMALARERRKVLELSNDHDGARYPS
jgi:hypothetical protein